MCVCHSVCVSVCVCVCVCERERVVNYVYTTIEDKASRSVLGATRGYAQIRNVRRPLISTSLLAVCPQQLLCFVCVLCGGGGGGGREGCFVTGQKNRLLEILYLVNNLFYFIFILFLFACFSCSTQQILIDPRFSDRNIGTFCPELWMF